MLQLDRATSWWEETEGKCLTIVESRPLLSRSPIFSRAITTSQYLLSKPESLGSSYCYEEPVESPSWVVTDTHSLLHWELYYNASPSMRLCNFFFYSSPHRHFQKNRQYFAFSNERRGKRKGKEQKKLAKKKCLNIYFGEKFIMQILVTSLRKSDPHLALWECTVTPYENC